MSDLISVVHPYTGYTKAKHAAADVLSLCCVDDLNLVASNL